MNPNINVTLFCNHVRTLIGKGNQGKEFTPTHVEVDGENSLTVTGTCPDYNDEEDEISIDWVDDCYYWVDFTRCTPLGPDVEQAYDTLTNYIGRLAKATCSIN